MVRTPLRTRCTLPSAAMGKVFALDAFKFISPSNQSKWFAITKFAR
ncbi:MAG: hypothetical protein ACTS46_00925 [Candidatus Hodgkinia cicadicola]